MEKYVIEGGHPLSGSVTISGNKNEALPAIAACLLTDEPVTLFNVPRIGDVNSMLDIMHELGVEIEDLDKNDVRLCSRNLKGSELDSDKCRSLRAAILLAGPLITRHDHVSM